MADRGVHGLSRRESVTAVGLLVAYGVVLALGRARIDQGDPDWMAWVLAGTTVVLAIAAMAVFIRAGRRSQELERFVFSESTSLAFFATMLAALTYGLLESLVDAPRLSAWSAWTFGMGSWMVQSLVVRRRLE